VPNTNLTTIPQTLFWWHETTLSIAILSSRKLSRRTIAFTILPITIMLVRGNDPALVSAEAIARLADEGKDVSRFFTNAGRMMGPIQRVNVDLAAGTLEELDRAAKEL
jgi:hypothetical protein